MKEKELQKAIESFLENPFWATYYDAAPSGAKEVIALEFYMSSRETVQDDAEALSVLDEVRANLDAEDLDYLAAHSPSPYERAFYRRQLTLRGEMGKIAAYVRFG